MTALCALVLISGTALSLLLGAAILHLLQLENMRLLEKAFRAEVVY